MPKRKAPEPYSSDLLAEIIAQSRDGTTRRLHRDLNWSDEPTTNFTAISERSALLSQISGFLETQVMEGVPAHERTLSRLIKVSLRTSRVPVEKGKPFTHAMLFSPLTAAKPVAVTVDPKGVSSEHRFHPPVVPKSGPLETEALFKVRVALERAEAQLVAAKTVREVQVKTNNCLVCGESLVSMSREAAFVCPQCGPALRDHGLSASVPTLFDAHEQQRHANDRRKNTSMLFAQFQQGVVVPREVFVRLRTRLANLHMHSHTEVKVMFMRDLLEQNGDKFYKQYAHRIMLQLVGAPMPSFTKQEIALVLRLYDFLQFPPVRVEGSSPNSKLIARVCCATLGLHEMKVCFPLLKDASALRRQDQVLANIFANIGLPYCPSI